MVEAIKVKNHKGLRECELNRLGRINILCGKNNSGKTTILEALNDIEKRTVGKKFTNEDYKLIIERTLPYMGWNKNKRSKSIQMEQLDVLYKKILDEMYNQTSQELKYLDEGEKFIHSIFVEYQKVPLLKQFRFPGGDIINIYNNFFSETIPTILLEPKRFLDVKKRIDGSEPISSSGPGILNHLFYCKNQNKSSEGRKVYDTIKKAFYDISSGYDFDIFQKKDNSLVLNFSYKKEPWIEAISCGLGLQDLLVILFHSIHPQNEMVLIEEPESHIHPDMQRKLLYFLKKETNKQFFLSTHSNVFLNNLLVDRIFYVYFEESVHVDDATSRAAILNDIGYSVTDNLVSDLIIFVEGLNDRPVLEEFLIKMGLYNKFSIKLWPLGGNMMAQLDLSVFAERNNIIALVDKDPKSDHIRKIFIKNCAKSGIHVHKLKRYSIENYFSLRAFKEVFGSKIKDTLKNIDPDKKIEDQLGFSPKKKNRKIVQRMTLEEIEDTDLYEFLKKIEEKCKEKT